MFLRVKYKPPHSSDFLLPVHLNTSVDLLWFVHDVYLSPGPLKSDWKKHVYYSWIGILILINWHLITVSAEWETTLQYIAVLSIGLVCSMLETQPVCLRPVRLDRSAGLARHKSASRGWLLADRQGSNQPAAAGFSATEQDLRLSYVSFNENVMNIKYHSTSINLLIWRSHL